MVAQSLSARLKNVAANEWAGPCPVCGGADRFSVNTRKGVFNCRGCGGRGSVIDLVMLVTGCSVIEAGERLTNERRPDHSRDETPKEELARLKVNSAHTEALRRREEDDAKAQEAKARRDQESIADVLERGGSIDRSEKGMAYLKGRGLASSSPGLLIDIRYVEELAYWGYRDNGSSGEEKLVHLATLPAVAAVIRDVRGEVIGLAETYLDKNEPRKWISEGSPRNSPKKVRGHKKGGMIRLGRIGETLALSEGWENALAYIALGLSDNEGVTFAAAVDLGNLSGRATGTIEHPWLKDENGRPRKIPNGVPDPDAPGVIIPDRVRSIILLGDSDSEFCATRAHFVTAANRFLGHSIATSIHWAPSGADWNEALLSDLGAMK
jgi:hypothetical protein